MDNVPERRSIWGVLGLAAVGMLAGCGGASNGGAHPISVSLHPQATSVVVGSQTQRFSATVSGDLKNLGATWAVDGIAGGNPAVGSISVTGLYTPPATAGVHTVIPTTVPHVTNTPSPTFASTNLPRITSFHYNLP